MGNPVCFTGKDMDDSPGADRGKRGCSCIQQDYSDTAIHVHVDGVHPFEGDDADITGRLADRQPADKRLQGCGDQPPCLTGSDRYVGAGYRV